MAERRERVARTIRTRRIDEDCERKLAELARAYRATGERFPPDVRPNGPFRDYQQKLRGHCGRCDGCPGHDSS